MQKFINKLESSLKDGSFVKLTLSKPVGTRQATSVQELKDIRNVYVKPIILRNEKMYSFTYRYESKTYYTMQKTFQEGYLAPELEVLEAVVEQGFGGSNMENIGDEKDPVGWN